MPYKITSNNELSKHVRRVLAKSRALWPATRQFGQYIAREARRNAPVGKRRNRGALKRSLNVEVIAHDTVVLQSPLPYAKIQQEGGTVRAGSGPLGARLLAIPIHPDAVAMLAGMGASVSLRTKNLQFIKTKSGKMFLVREAAVNKHGRARGPNKKGKMPEVNATQILFKLTPRVTITPQPYAPRMSEPAVRAFAAKVIRAHLTRSE